MPAPELFAFVPEVAQAKQVADHIRMHHFTETTVEVGEPATGGGCVAVLAGFPIADVVHEITGSEPTRVVTADELRADPDRLGVPWMSGSPDDDAYGRVTRPERYQIVVDAAIALIDRLEATYETERSAGEPEDLGSDWSREIVVTRLCPGRGAPLVVGMTDFPGVAIKAGNWYGNAFPTCGCDACDEQPLDVVEDMEQTIDAIVCGRLREMLTTSLLSISVDRRDGATGSRSRLERGEWKSLGKPGAYEWAPWPARGVSG